MEPLPADPAPGASAPDTTPPSDTTPSPDAADRVVRWLRPLVGLVALGVVVFVVLRPAHGLAPLQQILLLFLAGAIPAGLLLTETVAQFEMKLPGFLFTVGGAAAVMIGTFFLLKTQTEGWGDRVRDYTVVYADGTAAPSLDFGDGPAVQSPDGTTALKHYTARNTLAVVFTADAPRATVALTPSPGGPRYSGAVSFDDTTSVLVLCRHLRASVCADS